MAASPARPASVAAIRPAARSAGCQTTTAAPARRGCQCKPFYGAPRRAARARSWPGGFPAGQGGQSFGEAFLEVAGRAPGQDLRHAPLVLACDHSGGHAESGALPAPAVPFGGHFGSRGEHDLELVAALAEASAGPR